MASLLEKVRENLREASSEGAWEFWRQEELALMNLEAYGLSDEDVMKIKTALKTMWRFQGESAVEPSYQSVFNWYLVVK